MRKFLALLFATCVVCFITTSCNKDEEKYPDFAKMISKENITVFPEVLETIGGKVPATITVSIPPRFTLPTAEISLVAILVWDGGEVRSNNFGFQGEDAPDMGGEVIPYETGGKLTLKASYNYIPAMNNSEFFLEFDVKYQSRSTVFRIKIADGVISAS